jgi:peptidoglycan lytic transglycosylase
LRRAADRNLRLAPLFLALALAGCGSSAHYQARLRSGHPAYKVGAPYEINGVWYTPAVDYNYDRTGIASWYGEQFNERYTANGEVFDLNGLTAAHTTLPMPTIVQVTNLDNGRSLQLRVNDRGPFVGGRIIDVSRRAAQLLGFETRGTAPVRVKVLKEQSIAAADQLIRGNGGRLFAAAAPPPAPTPAPTPAPPPAPTPAPRRAPSVLAALIPAAEAAPLPAEAAPVVAVRPERRIFVQAGAFSQPESAQRMLTQVERLGSAAVVHSSIGGIDFYRVRLGPFASVEEADQLLARILGSGYSQARIVVD